MFGTDICYASQRPQTAALLRRLRDEGRISGSAFGAIARENARRILKL